MSLRVCLCVRVCVRVQCVCSVCVRACVCVLHCMLHCEDSLATWEQECGSNQYTVLTTVAVEV